MSKIYQKNISNIKTPVKLHIGGFTLIELLVVVLIIGIWAAIALPQYTRAVDKARSAQAITLLMGMKKALDVYYMANGQYPTSIEDLDIEIPKWERITSSGAEVDYWYPWEYCSFDNRGNGNFACNIKYSFGWQIMRLVPTENILVCVVVTSKEGAAFCKSLGFKEENNLYVIHV